MSHSEGIQDLGFRVADRFGADCADPHMTAILRKAPTLYRGIRRASELVNRTVSHCRIGVLQPPNCDYAYFYHQPSCDAHNPAIEQIGWYGLMTLIGMVRPFTGPQWLPTEIGLMTDHLPCRYIREHFPRTHMRLSQKSSYIALEHAVLSLPPLHYEAASPVDSPLAYTPAGHDLIGSLEQVMTAYLHDGHMNIELAAALCNTSKRTLQRRLMEEGSHYTEVLDRVNFQAASRMLHNPNIKITYIAKLLGYSDRAHFTRAFLRIAGVTPGMYRQQHTH